MKSLSTSDLRQLQDHAVQAAFAAGKILMKHFGKSLNVREKKNAGLVTIADVQAQQVAIARLRKAGPEFDFLAEESTEDAPGNRPGNQQATRPGKWIIDPLDGTTNYVHGFPMFCVSIAAEWQGELVAAVIYHPVLKNLYTAIRGQGARLDGKRIHVSSTSTIRNALITTGFTYCKDKWLRTEIEAFERMSDACLGVRRPGSAAMDLAFTASGIFDGFWERRLSPWDIAAGCLLVEEAGGRVTDFEGKPIRLDCRQILASNGKLHPSMLKLIRH